MSDRQLLSIAVVCEAKADRCIACDLADRVLCANLDWIAGIMDAVRRYRGLDDAPPPLLWSKVHGLAKEMGVKAHGWFSGQPGEPDALVARKALLLLVKSAYCPDVVLLIRDSDGFSQRRMGLEQARGERSWPFRIVLGVAHTKRECWVLNGFEARNAVETAKLVDLRAELGYHPCEKAERLTAQREGAKHDAKRVLRVLCGDSHEREIECWTQTSLETLEVRGEATGLKAYLAEIRERVVPLFLSSGGSDA